jgi:hypothetical protein
MNEIYAVDPAAPEDARELMHLVRLFGPTEGRFLYDFPSHWRTEALALIEREPEVMKQRATALLHRRRRAFVDPERHVPLRGTWSEAACMLQPRDGLIGPRGCPPTALPIDVALYDESALTDSRGKHVLRTPRGLREAAQMLFRISPRIVLVDPYLRLSYLDGGGLRRADRRFKPVLLELLRAAASARTEIMEIFVSKRSSEGESENDFADRLDRLKAEAGAAALQLQYGVLEEDIADLPGRRQHARYLLGIGSGLHFDHGFDSTDDGSLNHVHWLSESELRPLLLRFGLPDF